MINKIIMDEPLVGTPQQNYKFFYAASGGAIFSTLLLIVITGYTAFISTSAGELITDINEVILDLNTLLPDARESLRIVKEMCKHENFTKTWGDIC